MEACGGGFRYDDGFRRSAVADKHGDPVIMATVDPVNLASLLDDAKCFALVRQHRWPEGVRCPGCGSDAVVRNGHDDTQPHRQRYCCQACASRTARAATWTTSSLSGCGAASNTRKFTSTPMPASPRRRPVSAPGSASIMRSASTRAWATARHARPTKQNARGYVDDRLRRPAAPSPTSPPAQPTTTGLRLTRRKRKAMP